MKIKSLIRWAKLYDKKKLNLKTLNESTAKFETLLKKYGEKEPEVQDLYDWFKPLFQQIHNGEITKPKDDDCLAGMRRFMSETPPIAQYNDLLIAYGEFKVDLYGDRENPFYSNDGTMPDFDIKDDDEGMRQIKAKMKKDLAEADRKEREARKKKTKVIIRVHAIE